MCDCMARPGQVIGRHTAYRSEWPADRGIINRRSHPMVMGPGIDVSETLYIEVMKENNVPEDPSDWFPN